MSYATQQDLVDRFGARELIQLTDRTNKPQTAIDGVVVGRALSDADATIDGYVAKRYALPLPAVPPMLIKVASDLSRYYLHGEAAGPDSVVTRNFNIAIAWLKDVSKGLVTLDDGGAVPAPAGGGEIKASKPNRVFTRDSMKGF